MNNSFTDFFETLLPREFSIYVMPGSIALAVIDFYVIDPQYSLLCNFLKEVATFQTNDYIFGTLLWIAIAYVLGLVIGAIASAFRFLWKKLPNQKENTNKIDEGKNAMYIALSEQMMYRREIERYGVIARSMQNIAIAFGIWAFLELLNENSRFWLIFILIVVIALMLCGAKGYQELQRFRIKTLYLAMNQKKEPKWWRIIIRDRKNYF